jgi:predicted transcriptional regulator
MSLDPNPPARSAGTNFALTLLALSLVLFFAAQINATGNQKKVVSWQMTNGDKQIENIKANEAQLKDVIKQQDDVVKQVAKLQAEYQSIFEELLRMAEEDKDPEAQAIIKHFGIARQKKPGDTDKEKEKEKP